MSQSDDISPAQKLANAAMKSSSSSAEPEEKLWEGGFSAKAMFGTWILLLVVSILIIVGLVVLPSMLGMEKGTNILWGVGLGAILFGWLIAIANYLYRRIGYSYELTTQRLIHRHGILVRTTDRIELIDIDDVAFTQGIVQRMLNVGAIRISSTDRSHPVLEMVGIDDVNRISGILDDARRKERRRRSLHIETS